MLPFCHIPIRTGQSKASALLKKGVFLFFLTLGTGLSAQTDTAKTRNAVIKSISYNIYKADTDHGQVVRGKEKWPWYGYPIHYPRETEYFSPQGKLLETAHPNQRDTVIYNAVGQKVKMILFPGNSTDSITLQYHYDDHGNMVDELMTTSNPDMDFRMQGNLFGPGAVRDTYFRNYYAATTDSLAFATLRMEPGTYYRLFDRNNHMVEDKNMTLHDNGAFYKADTNIHRILYRYTKDGKVAEISTIHETHSGVVKKIYTGIRKERYSYTAEGKLQSIVFEDQGKPYITKAYTYYPNGELNAYSLFRHEFKRKDVYIHNDRGELIRYQNITRRGIKEEIRLEYDYNEQGDWIRCIHYDKKQRPTWWVERKITYYTPLL